MFQTHIHHWLQQFDNELFIHIFQLITRFGGKTTFLLFLSVLVFLINLDKGFIILQSVLIAILVTLGLKVAFNMPRPYHVDQGVQLWDEDLAPVILPYERKDATGFWALHKEESIGFFREKELHTWGFPSGHTSMAVVFWGSLALLFRKKWLAILCISMMLLIPFSRLYLGVHFLGDILGGYLLGGLLLMLFYKTLISPPANISLKVRGLYSPIWALGLPVIPISGWAIMEPQWLSLFGFLLAAYVTHWLALKKGLWQLGQNKIERLSRWILAGGLFLGLGLLIEKMEYLYFVKMIPFWPFFKSFFLLFGFFFGALWITHKLRKRKNEVI